MNRPRNMFCMFALNCIVPHPVCGDIFNVAFNDSDGVQWTGLVDMTADKLTISTWVENTGTGVLDTENRFVAIGLDRQSRWRRRV